MAENIGIKFTTIGGKQALADSASIAAAMESINIKQMQLVRSQTTASGITRTYQTAQQRLVTSTQKAGKEQEKYTKIVKDTTLAKKGLFGQTQSVLSAIGKVATWTVATGAVFGLFRALTGLVKTLMDFENALARVTTVTRGGAEALLRVRDAVKAYGRTTSAALVDVGKAAYYLGSAGLTATEQVAGLEHVMDLTVGTMGVVDQIARLVAGTFNVFGRNMEGAITASEKMQDISDILAHTYSCYTPDTEVLTDKGWKLFTELNKTEKIASLNPKTKELEYQKPHEYVNQHFEGKLCHLKGSFADIKITPTHKLYTQVGHRPVKKEYVLAEAKDVFGRPKKFYRGCKWRGRTPKYFILPEVENKTGDGKEKKIPIKTWIRFMAWYLSEGHCVWTNKDGKPIYCVTISQSSKSPYYNDLAEVMDLMPFIASRSKDSKRVGGFHIANKQLCAYLRQFGKAKEKHIPIFIKGLSKNLLRLFIETYAYGDGRREKENWAVHIFTSSNKMKDDFQEIALKADYGCTVGWRKGSEKFIKGVKTKSTGTWDVTISKRTEFLMNNKRNQYDARTQNRTTGSIEEWIDYKGNVVCVEVPNHVIFIRRNGKSFWCGNTQQVELSEIASAIGLVGSVAGLIEMPLKVLVGTLGELNSSLLKGTRAGTCYDEETEVLTKDGFKLWKDVTMNDVFATLNPKTHEMEYHKPNKIIRERYEGKMYCAVNKHLDLCVTPNHWMYTRQGAIWEKLPYEIKQAKDIFGRRRTYYRGTKWKGKEPKYFVLPSIMSNHGKNKEHTKKKEIPIPIETYLEFMGFYLSEGNINRYTDGKRCSYYRILISQTKKDMSKFEKIENCLKKMPFNFKYRHYQFAAQRQQLYEYLKKFGKANDKYVPQFIKDLSPKLLRIFLEAYRLGDGDKKGRIVTASIKMRDDIEEVALKAGYGVQHHILRKKGEISRPTWSEKTKKNVFCPTSDIWQINICKTVEVCFDQKRNVKLAKKLNYNFRTKEEWVDYKGMVYCCNVPNHIVFVRRRGKTVWCINSLMNAFLQISKKSDQLTDKLGVVFDPTKPLDFVEIMEKLNRRYGEGALSVMELKEIMDVFGLRGGRAVGILINRYERWRVTVNKGKEDFGGFADLMREQFENTLPRQLAILGNEIRVTFIEGFEKSGNALTRFIKRINKAMEGMREEREKRNRLIGLTISLYGEELIAASKLIKTEDILRTDIERRGKAQETLAGLIGEENAELLAQKEIYNLLTIDEADIVGKAAEVNEKKKEFLELLKKASGTEGSILEKMRSIYPELVKILGAETVRALIREGMLQNAIKNLAAEKDTLTTTKEILYSIRRELIAEDKRHQLQMMRMAGYTDEQIAHQNLINFVEKINAAKREELGVTENIVTLEQLLAATQEERLELLAQLGGNIQKNMTELLKLYNKELEAARKLTADIARNLERTVESGIEKLLTGTADWKEALQDIGKVLMKAQITEAVKVIKTTGIFETLASGVILDPVKRAHMEGGEEAAAKMESAGADVATRWDSAIRTAGFAVSDEWRKVFQTLAGEGAVGKTGVKAAITGVGDIGRIGKEAVSAEKTMIDSFIKSQSRDMPKSVEKGMKEAITWSSKKDLVTGITPFEKVSPGRGLFPEPTMAEFMKGAPGKGKGMFGDLSMAGFMKGMGGKGAAGDGFGTILNLAKVGITGALAGGAMRGDVGGAIGGAIGGIAQMALAATPFAPIAPLMPLLGGWLGSLFGGKKKEPVIERKEEERTTRVASKLDITNKQLEWVNRNLVALRVEREPYPMPESAYFAERWGGRGGGATFGNIIIQVGTDAQGRDVADAFAERFIVHGNRILQ